MEKRSTLSNDQHPKTMMQFLCPTQAPRRLITMMLLLASWAGSTAMASTDAREDLMTQTQAWLSQEMKVPAERITLTPINPKLRVRACHGEWQWKNFPAQSTVQATCQQPRVLFLIKWQAGGVSSETAAPAPRPSPARSATPAPAQTSPEPTPVTMRRALAINQTLPRGSHLKADMLTWVDVPAHTWGANHLGDITVVQGAELTRDMRPGQILSKHDIRPSVLVKKGQLVTIHIGEPGKMTISAQLQSLQDGRMGETINLKNPESGRILSGVVTGLNTVRNP
jgi:flagella basal body P-ring formation protein FlgA